MEICLSDIYVWTYICYFINLRKLWTRLLSEYFAEFIKLHYLNLHFEWFMVYFMMVFEMILSVWMWYLLLVWTVNNKRRLYDLEGPYYLKRRYIVKIMFSFRQYCSTLFEVVPLLFPQHICQWISKYILMWNNHFKYFWNWPYGFLKVHNLQFLRS